MATNSSYKTKSPAPKVKGSKGTPGKAAGKSSSKGPMNTKGQPC